jgi:hypothetical protein
MKDWLNRLLDPDKQPSSTSLIALITGLTGVVLGIISTFIDVPNGLDMSKFMIGAGILEKGMQHIVHKK